MQATQEISEVGRVLIDVIDEQPGIHFRALERAAHLNSAGQLRHHVDRLLRHKLIVEYEEGGYKRFFLNGNHDPQLLPRIARFARPVPRKIAKLLLVRSLSRTELRRRLGCADSTLGYHLTRMTLLGDVIKHRRCNSCHYSLADTEGVRAALHALEGSDGILDGQPNGTPGGEPSPSNGGAVPQGVSPYGTGHSPRPEPVRPSPADPVPYATANGPRYSRRPEPVRPSPADPVPYASPHRQPAARAPGERLAPPRDDDPESASGAWSERRSAGNGAGTDDEHRDRPHTGYGLTHERYRQARRLGTVASA